MSQFTRLLTILNQRSTTGAFDSEFLENFDRYQWLVTKPVGFPALQAGRIECVTDPPKPQHFSLWYIGIVKETEGKTAKERERFTDLLVVFQTTRAREKQCFLLIH